MPVSTAQIAMMLWPGLYKIHGDEFKKHPMFHEKMFDVTTSDKAYEETVGTVGTGVLAHRPEGSPTIFQDTMQGFVTRFPMLDYAGGVIVTKNAIADNVYKKGAERDTKALASSAYHTMQLVAANIYNRAFNSSYTGADGLEMCSTAHLNKSGGTYANELTTAADLSELSLEQACVDIENMKNDRGLNIALLPKALIIAPAERFNACRILKSAAQNDSANNAINALKEEGYFRDGVVVNPYLSDTDAWFIRTDTEGLQFFVRQAPEFSEDVDFISDNIQYKVHMRIGAGWYEPRAIFGSAGA